MGADDKHWIAEAGLAAHAKMPDGHGFILLAFEFGEGGRIRYCSNAKRESAINALKEFLLKCGAAEDWMKHIE